MARPTAQARTASGPVPCSTPRKRPWPAPPRSPGRSARARWVTAPACCESARGPRARGSGGRPGAGARGGGDDAWLAELVRRRPVCVSMASERPPETRPRVRWETRPLVWVTGPEGKGPRVPPRDFVFGALRVALDGNDPWAEPALAAYARAARATPALCEPMTTFNVASEVASCRR